MTDFVPERVNEQCGSRDEPTVVATAALTNGAIYLEFDASDLLGETSAYWTRYTMESARGTSRRHGFNSSYGDWDVEIAWPKGEGQVIYALGDIGMHTDVHFPRHTLLWVLRDGGAVVRDLTGDRPAQRTGKVIAFDCHQRHALRYLNKPTRRPRLWCAWNLDSDEPWTVERARAAIAKATSDGAERVHEQVRQPIRDVPNDGG